MEWQLPGSEQDQFYSDIVIGFLLLWIAWSFARVRRVSMWIGTLLLRCGRCSFVDWWIPYAKSARKSGRFSFYSQRTQILPVIVTTILRRWPCHLDFLLFLPLFALMASIANLRTGGLPNAI